MVRKGDGTGLAAKGYSQVRKGDGAVLWDAIPDSGDLHARYDASALNLDDKDRITSWRDETGNGHDLTDGVGATFVADGVNGNPAVRFDGVDDVLYTNYSALPQPNHIFGVYRLNTIDNSIFNYIWGSADGDNSQDFYQGNDTDDLALSASEQLGVDNVADTNVAVTSALYDGGSSALRLNGSEIVSGDAGGDDMAGLTLADRWGNSGDRPAEVDWCELLVYPEDKSAIQSDVEQYLDDKWGPIL